LVIAYLAHYILKILASKCMRNFQTCIKYPKHKYKYKYKYQNCKYEYKYKYP